MNKHDSILERVSKWGNKLLEKGKKLFGIKSEKRSIEIDVDTRKTAPKSEPVKKQEVKKEVKVEVPKQDPKKEIKIEVPKQEPKKEVKVEAPKQEPKKEVKIETPKQEPKKEVKIETPKQEPKKEVKVEAPKQEPKKEVKAEASKQEPKKEVKAEAPKKEPRILFDDIEKHDEIFDHILEELATVKENLKMDTEEDQTIFTDILNTFERKINKAKKDIAKGIEKENIYDDEYSQTATLKFINLLDSNYKKLINVTLSKINHNQGDTKVLKSTLELLENFLFDLGFIRKDYDIKTIDIYSDSVLREFEILPISTDNPKDDNKVSIIEELPYIIKYIDDIEEETTGVLKGTLFLMKYKEENK